MTNYAIVNKLSSLLLLVCNVDEVSLDFSTISVT